MTTEELGHGKANAGGEAHQRLKARLCMLLAQLRAQEAKMRQDKKWERMQVSRDLMTVRGGEL
jgi:hypothetical protein